MNSNRNYLHVKISDLEKVINELEVEQKRMLAKKETVTAELHQREYQLE